MKSARARASSGEYRSVMQMAQERAALYETALVAMASNLRVALEGREEQSRRAAVAEVGGDEGHAAGVFGSCR